MVRSVSAGDRIELPVTLVDISDDDSENHPCDWCSTIEHNALVYERGLIEAVFRVENTYGVTMGYACDMCLDGAPKVGE